MNILIIGNGFDLAHGLKTSYKDFLEYQRKYVKPFLNSFGVPNHFEKEEVNVWLNYFLEKQQELGDTWIDFETEIYNVVTKIQNTVAFPQCSLLSAMHSDFLEAITDSHSSYLEKLQPIGSNNYKNYNHLESITNYAEYQYYGNSTSYFFKSHKGLINFLYDQLRDFTEDFEKYLIENVNNLSPTSQYQLHSSKGRNGQQFKWDVISFNYTNTFIRLYQSVLNTSSIDATVYVHGKASANTQNCDLVLGTHSFDRKDENKNLPYDLNVFQKHNQRNKYGTIETYQGILRRIKSHKNNVTIAVIGHSLDKTDHSVLKYIFTANKNTQINIYYHNEEAHDKLIENITKIIGEDEVTAKVRFIDQHDKNCGLLKLIRSNS